MEKDNILMSVVTTCFNQNRYIEKAIESISEQTYKNWELIIIDDASTDDSVKTIKETIKKLNIENKVKLIINKENKGCGFSLKRGIENTNGYLVSIVDGDDAIAHKKAFRIIIKYHLKYPNASMTYSNYYDCDKHLKPIRLYRSRQIEEGRSYADTKIRISHLKTFKKHLYDKSLGVNSKLYQTVDKDLVLKLEEVGDLLWINETLYYYRKHNRSLTRTWAKKGKEYYSYVSKMRKLVFVEAKERRKK